MSPEWPVRVLVKAIVGIPSKIICPINKTEKCIDFQKIVFEKFDSIIHRSVNRHKLIQLFNLYMANTITVSI